MAHWVETGTEEWELMDEGEVIGVVRMYRGETWQGYQATSYITGEIKEFSSNSPKRAKHWLKSVSTY